MRSHNVAWSCIFRGGQEQMKALGSSLALEMPPGPCNNETWVVEVTTEGTVKMEEEMPTKGLFQKVLRLSFNTWQYSGRILGGREALSVSLYGICAVAKTLN